MRRILLGTMGLLGGAFVGFCGALLAVWLWYDVLNLDDGQGGAKAGLGALLMFGPIAMAGFAAIGAWQASVRDRAGKGMVPTLVFGAFGLIFVVWLAAMLGLA